MTQAGPAIPVVVSTQPPDGGPALRVAVVADGRPTEAGPVRPVVVVTDGRPTQGNDPVPVVASRGNGFTLAGPPIPVVVVSGSLTPITDPLLDSFSDTKAAGTVIGSNSPSGALRRGADTEGKLYTNGAGLFYPPPTTAGWNRQGDAYGPYPRTNGLAVVIRLIDGDVQSNDGTAQHLAAGWFDSANPANPLTDGHAFVFADNGASGGKLQINGSALVDIISSIKQTEHYLIIVLRSTGAALYAGGPSGATEEPGYPNIRPLRIALTDSTASMYAAVWQRYQTPGANNTTQERKINVAQIAAWAQWYGSAHAADTLISSSGSIVGRAADGVGGSWSVLAGGFSVTNGSGMNGTVAGNNLAKLDPGVPSGLIKATFVIGASVPEIGVAFRIVDASNYWLFFASPTAFVLRKVVAGVETSVQSTGGGFTTGTHVLQVIDDGTRIRTYYDQVETPSVGGFPDSTTHVNGTGVGFRQWQNTAGNFARDFEAHPRTIALPAALDLGAIYQTQGTTVVATETFAGGAADLNGLTTTTGGLTWSRLTGTKTVSRDGSGNGIVGATGTTSLYAVPWASTGFADVALDVRPPGAGFGSGANSHAGVLLWQDASNWIAFHARVDDDQPSASEIEVTYSVGGVVKRVNFGTVINHGVTTTVRASCDGTNVIVWRGTQPAFNFALVPVFWSTPLAINKVGTYETAQDTGSTFDNFVARSA